MKMLKRILYILPIIGMVFTSCVDIESKDFEHIGGYNTMDKRRKRTILCGSSCMEGNKQGLRSSHFFRRV